MGSSHLSTWLFQTLFIFLCERGFLGSGICSPVSNTVMFCVLLIVLLSTGSGRHSDAAHEIRLIGCCILLNFVPKTVPLSSSSQSPLDRLSPFGRLASLEAMHLFLWWYPSHGTGSREGAFNQQERLTNHLWWFRISGLLWFQSY